jgi:hypothetical protein
MAIATLIAAGRLDDRLVDRALGLLREVDPGAVFSRWVDEGDAADLEFAGDLKSARWALSSLEGVDAIVQGGEPRWRKLLVADMDSTIVGQECLDELADYAGLKDRVARITGQAMRGEIDFSGALRERVRLLAGLDERDLGFCHLRPVGGRAGVGRIEHSIEPVSGTGALLRRRCRAQHRDVAIDLRAVGIDDRASALLGELECKRGLAARRRSRD